MITLRELQRKVFKTAFEHGWWPLQTVVQSRGVEKDTIDLSQVNIPEKLALMHEEISEALGHYRSGHMELYYSKDEQGNDKPDGFYIELADTIIRILDFAEAYGVDMEAMVRIKMEYNDTRPYRHGNKKC